jgi:hypothetical protein
MIRLQFSTSTEWQSDVIRRLCHSPFSHLDVVLPDGNLLGSSDSPHAPSIEGNPGGVAIRPPDYQTFGIRRMANVFSTEAVELAFYTKLRSQLGEPFDDTALHAFIGKVSFMPTRDWTDSSSWFCSELVAWALMEAGFFRYELLVPKDRISPADLLLLLNPFIDTTHFWDPIPGLKLGPKEH